MTTTEAQDRPLRTFPAGCVIKDIRPGKGKRINYVYASLYGPDGELLISATLDYINDAFRGSIIEPAKAKA